MTNPSFGAVRMGSTALRPIYPQWASDADIGVRRRSKATYALRKRGY